MKNLSFLTLICFSLLIISCGEDPIPGCIDPASSTFDIDATEDDGSCQYPGCTDEDADNYDSTANVDDTSCIYFNRFTGTYSGTFNCMGIGAEILDEATSVIAKKNDDNNMDVVTVVVSNTATALTLNLEGIITKDNVVINTFIPDFEYTIDFNGIPVDGPYEITISGTLTRVDDTTLDGPLSISIVKAGTILGASDTCQYTATKM